MVSGNMMSRGHGEQNSLQSFLEKVFSGVQDSSKMPLLTFDDCRYKLETMFEEKYQPERDFIDYLNIKKERSYEDCEPSADKSKLTSVKGDLSKKRNSPPSDDQDLMPMDLDEDHNLPSALSQ